MPTYKPESCISRGYMGFLISFTIRVIQKFLKCLILTPSTFHSLHVFKVFLHPKVTSSVARSHQNCTVSGNFTPPSFWLYIRTVVKSPFGILRNPLVRKCICTQCKSQKGEDVVSLVASSREVSRHGDFLIVLGFTAFNP